MDKNKKLEVNSTEGTGGTLDSGYTPPATQEELNDIIESRLNKERKKYADYSELKEKVQKFEEAQEKNRTDAERIEALEKKIKAAEARSAELERAQQLESWKKEVAKKTGIPAEALRGDSLEDLEAHASVLKTVYKQPAAPLLNKDGEQPGSSTPDAFRTAARELFSNG